MDPPCINVLLREFAEDCGSWSPHSLSWCYIVPSLEHYCFRQICIPANNLVCIGQTVSWFPYKIIMPTATDTSIIIATAKDLTAALKKLLLPPYDTITHKALLQLNSIFSNASSALKPQKIPFLKLPMVSTTNPVAAPSRVSPSTTQYFQNISPTTKKHCKDLWAVKSKTSPKTSPFLSPSPKIKSNPRRITWYLDSTDYYFTTMNLPSKIQHLFQQEINWDSNPSINPLLKTNVVLYATTVKMLEFKKMKGSDNKNWINGCSKQYLRKVKKR